MHFTWFPSQNSSEEYLHVYCKDIVNRKEFVDQFVVVIKLLQTMTYFHCLIPPTEKLPMAANIRSEFSDYQWY